MKSLLASHHMHTHSARTIALAASLALAACSSITDPTEKNFGAAMNQYFSQMGELCLDTRHWPVELSEVELRLQRNLRLTTATQMEALEKVGLVASQEITVHLNSALVQPPQQTVTFKRYTLTEAAAPYVRERTVPMLMPDGQLVKVQKDLCWGKKQLDKIVGWEEFHSANTTEAKIAYVYKLAHVANWATHPAVQAAFPSVKSVMADADATQFRHVLTLTHAGWQAKGI